MSTDIFRDLDQKKAHAIVAPKLAALKHKTENTLAVAVVTEIDYEQHRAKVFVLQGGPGHFTDQFSLTYPGAGMRGFLGRVPEVGDICILGYAPGTTGKPEDSTPVVLSWQPPSPWMAQDWLPLFDIAPDDPLSKNLKTLKAKQKTATGFFRSKLRHVLPGSVLASSSQGSDLILDSDVLLTNRRANEIRLRDADQAFIVRSLQQFHVMGGARIYAGMVQRDYGLIPQDMYTLDGLIWDSPISFNKEDGNSGTTDPLNSFLKFSLIKPTQFIKNTKLSYRLLPNEVFKRDGGVITGKRVSGIEFPDTLDPYILYTRYGLLYPASSLGSGRINTELNFLNSRENYGGIDFRRVTVYSSLYDSSKDKKVSPVNEGLTEYRIEVAHQYDGTLPVSEQTERFDADRLPATSVLGSGSSSRNSPFVEVVYGSVVGNDICTAEGLKLYGHALTAVLYGGWGENKSPKPLTTANLTKQSPISPDEPESKIKLNDLGSQAATLLRVRPSLIPNLNPKGGIDTYFSVSKDGRAFLKVGGPVGLPSVEAYLSNGLKLFSRGRLELETGSYLDLLTRGSKGGTGQGVALKTIGGGIYLDAQGLLKLDADKLAADSTHPLPGVFVNAVGAIHLKTPSSIVLDASKIDFGNGDKLNINALTKVDLSSAGSISMTSETLETTVMGQSNQTFVGPIKNIPTNGPTRITKFHSSPATGHITGAVDSLSIDYGDQETQIIIGSKKVNVRTGNIENKTLVGAIMISSGVEGLENSLELDVSGISMRASTGDIDITNNNPIGSMTLKAMQDISIESTKKVSIVGTLGGVHLGGPGIAGIGNILSSLDKDPITGLPYLTYGMGASSITLGAAL
jgi:hypothetical protein